MKYRTVIHQAFFDVTEGLNKALRNRDPGERVISVLPVVKAGHTTHFIVVLESEE